MGKLLAEEAASNAVCRETKKYDWFLEGHVVEKIYYPVRGWLMKDGKVCGPFPVGEVVFGLLRLVNDTARFRLENCHYFNLEVYADNRWQILTEFIYLNSKEAKL